MGRQHLHKVKYVGSNPASATQVSCKDTERTINASLNTVRIEKERGEETMLYTMIFKERRQEKERFWFCRKRLFVMPLPEKQIMPVIEVPV